MAKYNDRLGKLLSDLRSISEKYECTSTDAELSMSSEDREAIDRINKEIDDLEVLIDTEKRSASIKAVLETPVSSPIQVATPEDRTNVLESDEYRSAWYQAFCSGDFSEIRAMTEGSATAGGNTVPTALFNRIVEKIDASSVMRRLATVVPINTQSIDFPVEGTTPAASIVSEASTISPADQTINKVTITAYGLKKLTKVSDELLNDNQAGFETWLANFFARSFTLGEDVYFVAGTGSSQPQGVVVGSTLGKTFAGQAAITADELFDVQHSLGEQYRANASWIMADATFKSLRVLKGTQNDHYILQPGLNGAATYTLLGSPVYTNSNMPAMTTGLKSVVYGDMASAYYIADRDRLEITRSVDFAFDEDVVAVRGISRVGGAVVNTDAVKHGIQA